MHNAHNKGKPTKYYMSKKTVKYFLNVTITNTECTNVMLRRYNLGCGSTLKQ